MLTLPAPPALQNTCPHNSSIILKKQQLLVCLYGDEVAKSELLKIGLYCTVALDWLDFSS